MRCGRVYVWVRDSSSVLGGHVSRSVEPLLHLDAEGEGNGRLWGRYVRVRNGGAVYEADPETGAVTIVPIGDAKPNADGDFIFGWKRGGRRIDKVLVAKPSSRTKYIEASHFGEVNTYYHLDRIAAYVDELLHELGAPGLPRVIAVVNAHHAATERFGVRDGIRGTKRWLPFQGGHYRLPSRRYDIPELEPISPDGEIHLGPGWQLLERGALVESTGRRYRANASHNAGILYHEYGHHVTQHTADFQANALRPPDRQRNRKTAMDEGMCDYVAATMLGTPHIWAWHRRHDEYEIHHRSLVSTKTMADYDGSSRADPHANGTIWAAALWDLRTRLAGADPNGVRKTDLLVLQALLLIGQLMGDLDPPTPDSISAARAGYSVGLTALLHADELLYVGHHRGSILAAFARRGIRPDQRLSWAKTPEGLSAARRLNRQASSQTESFFPVRGIMRHVAPEEIPANESLLTGEMLEAYLRNLAEPPLSLIAVGDLMLGGRTTQRLVERGPYFAFEAVRPLLQRAEIVMGNLEGPFARKARKFSRAFSYRVNPDWAHALSRAGFNVVTLANNHLLDCGRAGVLETLEALRAAGIEALGGGIDEEAAHAPVIRQAGSYRIGLLGYYWNRRTAATANLPGSAVGTRETLERDIRRLRDHVDRIVATFHWGVPYEREVSPEDRAKARFAIDCGADVVIGHHPHVIQPFEIYRGRPIFYSVGNFAFGSGNSLAEGIVAGIRFEDTQTSVYIYPLYVKNRDPRINYQPKMLKGQGAKHVLDRLADLSGADGSLMIMEESRARLVLPHSHTKEMVRTHGRSI